MDPEQWADIINACLEQGCILPLHRCAVSVPGAVMVVRSDQAQEDEDALEGTVVVEPGPAPGFILPIHRMITDADGEAVRVRLSQPAQWDCADLH
jgi:hypothetical protein